MKAKIRQKVKNYLTLFLDVTKSKPIDDLSKFFNRSIIALLCIFALLIWVYISKFKHNPWGQPSDFGAFGDYIGGILNPFIAFLALLGLWQTNKKQVEMLEKQIEEEKNRTREAIERAEDQERKNAERQKHESFMKMYEAYVRVLGDGSSLEVVDVTREGSVSFYRYKKDEEPNSLIRMAYHLLNKELAQKGVQKWDNIRFFRAQLSEKELRAMAKNCLHDDEGREGLAVVAKKTGLFKYLKFESYVDELKRQPDSEGFFNLEVTENEYKDKSVKI
jgi:hypothetical protein